MADTSGLLAQEYEAINAHLQVNIGQSVNWFSFFLTFSFVALAVFVATGDRWPRPRLLDLEYAMPAVFLLMHMLAFAAFRAEAHCQRVRVSRTAWLVGGADQRRSDEGRVGEERRYWWATDH